MNLTAKIVTNTTPDLVPWHRVLREVVHLCSLLFADCPDESWFVCVSDGTCLPPHLRCDDVAHCVDASDEHDCGKYILYRVKPEKLHILSFEKGQGRRSRPFSRLRF